MSDGAGLVLDENSTNSLEEWIDNYTNVLTLGIRLSPLQYQSGDTIEHYMYWDSVNLTQHKYSN